MIILLTHTCVNLGVWVSRKKSVSLRGEVFNNFFNRLPLVKMQNRNKSVNYTVIKVCVAVIEVWVSRRHLFIEKKINLFCKKEYSRRSACRVLPEREFFCLDFFAPLFCLVRGFWALGNAETHSCIKTPCSPSKTPLRGNVVFLHSLGLLYRSFLLLCLSVRGGAGLNDAFRRGFSNRAGEKEKCRGLYPAPCIKILLCMAHNFLSMMLCKSSTTLLISCSACLASIFITPFSSSCF